MATSLVDPEPGCLQMYIVGSVSEVVNWCVPEAKAMVFPGGVMHQVSMSDPPPPLSALGVSGLPGLSYHYLVCRWFSRVALLSLRY